MSVAGVVRCLFSPVGHPIVASLHYIQHFAERFAPQPRRYPVSDLITHVNDDAFEQQVLKSETPVLLDFWAEWCGPCKAIAPMLEDLAKQYEGKLRVVKVNIDHNQQTPRAYGVRGIPTLMVFKNGKVEATQIGAVSKGQLTQMIDKAI
jgi:thioredoxin 1